MRKTFCFVFGAARLSVTAYTGAPPEWLVKVRVLFDSACRSRRKRTLSPPDALRDNLEDARHAARYDEAFAETRELKPLCPTFLVIRQHM